MAKEQVKEFKLETAPFDARFPNQNQTRNCYQNYLDFHRCVKVKEAKGESTEMCQYFKRVYKSLCPSIWVSLLTDVLVTYTTYSDVLAIQVVKTSLSLQQHCYDEGSSQFK